MGDIQNNKGIIPPPLYPESAKSALNVFQALKIPDLIGQPYIKNICAPWVFDLVKSIFGALNPQTNIREITNFFLLVAKKNTKSTIAAAVMLTTLITNKRPNAELLILAPTKEIADNSFQAIIGMIKAEPVLQEFLHIQDHIKRITNKKTGSVLKVLAADKTSVSGTKASFVLVDELWIFGTKHDATQVLQEATGGLVSRPEGFVIYLSTQSERAPAGVFRDKLNYARKVRDGLISDPRFLPVIYEYSPQQVKEGLYKNPDYFHIANPNIGVSIQKDDLISLLRSSEAEGETAFQSVLAKHFNVEVATNIYSNTWEAALYWDKNKMDGCGGR